MIVRLLIALLLLLNAHLLFADSDKGQVLQITTNFDKVIGEPFWTLIVRDEDSGKVTPYIFNIKEKQNAWVVFTFGHNYKIVDSQLTFKSRTVNNFCNLINGVISGKSMFLYLKGKLSTNPDNYKCIVSKYKHV